MATTVPASAEMHSEFVVTPWSPGLCYQKEKPVGHRGGLTQSDHQVSHSWDTRLGLEGQLAEMERELVGLTEPSWRCDQASQSANTVVIVVKQRGK